MIIDKKIVALIAVLFTVTSVALWGFNVIPWWGILIAVPVGTVALSMLLFVLAIAAWMASGSH